MFAVLPAVLPVLEPFTRVLIVHRARFKVEVLVPDNADRGHFFSQAREQQLSMGLRDVGRRVPYDGKRRWDGRPANGRGRMRYIIELVEEQKLTFSGFCSFLMTHQTMISQEKKLISVRYVVCLT